MFFSTPLSTINILYKLVIIISAKKINQTKTSRLKIFTNETLHTFIYVRNAFYPFLHFEVFCLFSSFHLLRIVNISIKK